MAIRESNKVKAMEVARLVAEGNDVRTVGRLVGVTKDTVCAWMRDPEVKAEYMRCVRDLVSPAVAKSVQTLVNQTKAKNQWLAQGAAREILNRFGAAVLGEEERAVTIRFEQGQSMPDVGVPQPPEDD